MTVENSNRHIRFKTSSKIEDESLLVIK